MYLNIFLCLHSIFIIKKNNQIIGVFDNLAYKIIILFRIQLFIYLVCLCDCLNVQSTQTGIIVIFVHRKNICVEIKKQFESLQSIGQLETH